MTVVTLLQINADFLWCPNYSKKMESQADSLRHFTGWFIVQLANEFVKNSDLLAVG